MVLIVLWCVWFAYWLHIGADAKPAQFRNTGSPLAYAVPLVLTWILLLCPSHIGAVPLPHLGTVLLALGHAFTVWARVHLGRNWAGDLSIQRDHQLVTTGPYRFFRHPIYAGLMLAFIGTALLIGTVTAWLAPLAALWAFVTKARIEEQQLSLIFAEYEDYRKRTLF